MQSGDWPIGSDATRSGIPAMYQDSGFQSMPLESKWGGNNDQMVGFLRNFLDLKPTDSLSASPPQAQHAGPMSNGFVGMSQSSLQKGLFAVPHTHCNNNVIKVDTLSDIFPCKNLATNSKGAKPMSTISRSQFRHDIFDPFAFGEPVEDSLSEPQNNKPRPPITSKELDSFSPLVGFEDFLVHPVLVPPQLEKNGFARPKDGNPKKANSCRKRDSAEPLRPQKKIRTTFAVKTKAIKEEAVVIKSEQKVVVKEPVKVARSRKNNRERQRRQGLNQKFQELIEVLALQDCRNVMKGGVGSKGPKWNKHDILSEAIHAITNLRTRLTSAEARLHALGSS